MPGGLVVNALGNAEILNYPDYKLNLYVVVICLVAASGGLLFGAQHALQFVPFQQLADCQLACMSSMPCRVLAQRAKREVCRL